MLYPTHKCSVAGTGEEEQICSFLSSPTPTHWKDTRKARAFHILCLGYPLVEEELSNFKRLFKGWRIIFSFITGENSFIYIYIIWKTFFFQKKKEGRKGISMLMIKQNPKYTLNLSTP